MVQWLRLYAPNAEGLGSIPSQGTRSHRPQLSSHATQLFNFVKEFSRYFGITLKGSSTEKNESILTEFLKRNIRSGLCS